MRTYLKTKRFFPFIIATFLLLGCVTTKVEQTSKPKGYSNITADELMQEIEHGKKFVLVDVRTPDEYDQGHLKGAILIPHTEIRARYKEISKRFG